MVKIRISAGLAAILMLSLMLFGCSEKYRVLDDETLRSMATVEQADLSTAEWLLPEDAYYQSTYYSDGALAAVIYKNKAGQELRRIAYSSDGKVPVSRIEYRYYQNGLLAQERRCTLAKDGAVTAVAFTGNTFRDNGVNDRTVSVSADGAGAVTTYSITQYTVGEDGKNNGNEKISYSPSGSVINRTVSGMYEDKELNEVGTYSESYDDTDTLVSRSIYYTKYENGIRVADGDRVYDKDGNVTDESVQYYNADGTPGNNRTISYVIEDGVIKERYTLERDSAGNTVKDSHKVYD